MMEDPLQEIDPDAEDKSADEHDALSSFTPSLLRLSLDEKELLEGDGSENKRGLRGGFESTQELVEWEQRLTVRTLGEVPQFIFQGIADHLATGSHSPLIAGLLDEETLEDEVAAEVRERFWKYGVQDYAESAFRRLRIDAAEYVSESSEGTKHHPEQQRYIAMRPGLDELDTWQRSALLALFNESNGLDDGSDILAWKPIVRHATYGEPIQFSNGETAPVSEFLNQCHEREWVVDQLTNEENHIHRVLFAARYLIPSFNAGVRERMGKSGELPEYTGTIDRGMKDA